MATIRIETDPNATIKDRDLRIHNLYKNLMITNIENVTIS